MLLSAPCGFVRAPVKVLAAPCAKLTGAFNSGGKTVVWVLGREGDDERGALCGFVRAPVKVLAASCGKLSGVFNMPCTEGRTFGVLAREGVDEGGLAPVPNGLMRFELRTDGKSGIWCSIHCIFE